MSDMTAVSIYADPPENQRCVNCPHFGREGQVGRCYHEGRRKHWLVSAAFGCENHPNYVKPDDAGTA